jgi:hypothetical protein
MGAKAPARMAFSARLNRGQSLLDSCRPEQRGHEGIGVAAAAKGQSASVLLLLSQNSPTLVQRH